MFRSRVIFVLFSVLGRSLALFRDEVIKWSLGYFAHVDFDLEIDDPVADDEGRHTNGSRTGICTVGGLVPETNYMARFIARSEAGVCEIPSSPVSFATSERPTAPAQLRYRVAPQRKK